MKLKPSTLFAITTVLFLLCGILTRTKTLDIQLHDTYYVINYLHLAIMTSLITGLKSFIYFRLDKLKRPIKAKTGHLHFGLFMSGLFLMVLTNYLPSPAYHANSADNTFSAGEMLFSSQYLYNDMSMIALLIGITLFLLSFFIFAYTLVKTLIFKYL